MTNGTKGTRGRRMGEKGRSPAVGSDASAPGRRGTKMKPLGDSAPAGATDYHDWDSIQAVTPTCCALLGVPVPSGSVRIPLADVVQHARGVLDGVPVEKCLIFAPDAIGNHLFKRRPELLEDVIAQAPVEVALQSVMPPKTPACFASMFTGARPDQHGIRKYEKPALQCDTLFDALRRAGKQVAIVSVRNCSIDLIFRGRDLDYYSENYDPEVTGRVLSLLEAGRHDIILAYHQEYDDIMHDTGPFSPEALRAARNNVDGFVRMAGAVDRYWGRHSRMVAFVPDHGAHTNRATGLGDHGEDVADDMELKHFYGFRRA